MSKIFEFNKGQSGTLIDSVSGIQGTLNSGSFKKTEKGMALYNPRNLTYPDSDILDGMDELSIVCWIKPMEGGDAFHHIVTKDYTSGYGLQYCRQRIQADH
jgi:hypothetical protein